jgi:hypothetical protein
MHLEHCLGVLHTTVHSCTTWYVVTDHHCDLQGAMDPYIQNLPSVEDVLREQNTGAVWDCMDFHWASLWLSHCVCSSMGPHKAWLYFRFP